MNIFFFFFLKDLKGNFGCPSASHEVAFRPWAGGGPRAGREGSVIRKVFCFLSFLLPVFFFFFKGKFLPGGAELRGGPPARGTAGAAGVPGWRGRGGGGSGRSPPRGRQGRPTGDGKPPGGGGAGGRRVVHKFGSGGPEAPLGATFGGRAPHAVSTPEWWEAQRAWVPLPPVSGPELRGGACWDILAPQFISLNQPIGLGVPSIPQQTAAHGAGPPNPQSRSAPPGHPVFFWEGGGAR